MFNIHNTLRHAVLALGLAAASLSASAGVLPTYQIRAADTATADIAAIDFLFYSDQGAATVVTTLSRFPGNPFAEVDTSGVNGDVSPTSDGFAIGNTTPYNDLTFGVGGPFVFNVNFSEGFLGFDNTPGSPFDSNSYFSIALFDSSGGIIDDERGVLNFTLSKTGVVYALTTTLLTVNEIPADAAAVPEPAGWILMLTGLCVVVCITRRNGRVSARRLAAA